MITVEDINKSFGHTKAVQDLSFVAEDSEVFGLVGPNGAGKTTTIKMMTGLLTPDRGRILIGRHDIVKAPEEAKKIMGYVPDKAFLYDKLTASEFLSFIASLYGVEKNTALGKIPGLLDLFGILDQEDELIESFSQGMRQRILFASALIHDPSVLLIDEPFVGLDPFGVRMLTELIAGLGQKGITVLLATHNLHIAEELCHRVGFIRKGSLIAVKDRDEIKMSAGGLEGMFLDISR